MSDSDVIVVGGGIAGLAAAYRLQQRGLKVVVLEADSRIGGRMTTDRRDGFVMDRGVTLLSNAYKHMRKLALDIGLGPTIRSVEYPFGFQCDDSVVRYRARHPEDFLFDPRISLKAKLASLRIYIDLLFNKKAAVNGESDAGSYFDTEDALEYINGLGQGGHELFTKVLEPGLKAVTGGPVTVASRQLVFNIFHLLSSGLWNLTDGVDTIPCSIASKLDVVTNAPVTNIEFSESEIRVSYGLNGSAKTSKARGTIVAIPGQLVSHICPSLPDWISRVLAKASYSKIAVACVALGTPPNAPYAGYAYTRELQRGVPVLELQHNRAPNRCPEGKGMVNVYFVNDKEFNPLELTDEELKARAVDVVGMTFPECKGTELFVHIIRWPIGIAFFQKGRFKELAELRSRLPAWEIPLDFAGDHMDGYNSESALRTGEQAADRIAAKLTK